MGRWIALTLLAACACASVAAGGPAARASESIGSYSNGSLVDGVQMPAEGVDHYLVFPDRCYAEPAFAPYYPDPARAHNTWGHATTIAALLEALAAARARHPEAPRIAVAEIANAAGGQIEHHLSHRTGLDADIVFWQRGRGDARHPIAPCTPYGAHERFERRDADGRWSVPASFEAAWNWTLAEVLAARDDVKAIFVGALVKRALEVHARAIGVPADVRRRTLTKLVTVFCAAPRGLDTGFYRNNWCPHDDHFHVRFRCPKDSPRCREQR